MLTDTSTVQMAEHVSIADLGGDAVLMDGRSGEYFGLNEVGARIFTLAQDPATVQQILDEILDEFDVDRDRLRADAVAFLADLKSKKLIQVH